MKSLCIQQWPGPAVSFSRRPSRRVLVGDVTVGGGAPVTVQSMTNTDTRDLSATVTQINRLAAAGCQLVRVAVPDRAAVRVLPAIMRRISIPLIADIHFRAELALAAIESGVQGVRINPGNIGQPAQLKSIARAAAAAGTALRVGVNGGSLEADLLARSGGRVTAAALTASALRHCEQFEEWGCHNLKVSLKSSSVTCTIEACRQFAMAADYPLHLGLTEAGLPGFGEIKSAAALGCLLMEGIGDTLRVSLTGDPVQEVVAGRRILAACGLIDDGPEIISCPTCGRTEIDLLSLAGEVAAEVERLQAEGYMVPLKKIAVMGCVVNGPGEAVYADLGIAGGRRKGVLFRHGQVIGSFPEKELKERLLREIRIACAEHRE